MVRTYKRRTPPVKVEKLQAAIAAVENGLTLHTSAKVFAVSASTLHRHLNQKEKPLHRNQVFNEEQEKALVKYVMRSTARCYGPTSTGVRTLAFAHANKLALQMPSSWASNSIAGRDWFQGFMKRHPNLSFRKINGKVRVCASRAMNAEKEEERESESDLTEESEDEDDEGDEDSSDEN